MEVGHLVRQSKGYLYLLSTGFGKYLKTLFINSKQAYFKILSRIRGFEDYFDFPFDITKPMPSSSQNELVDLVNFLNSENMTYFFAEGSLLGLVRDGKLIDHDTDLDFYLTDTERIGEIDSFLGAKGYKVGRRLTHKGRLCQMTYFNRDFLLIDFLFWQRTEDGNFFWIGPEIKGRRIQNSSYFDSPTYITWKNISIRTFWEYESWLKLVYGDSWTIPENIKTDWTKSIGDLK